MTTEPTTASEAFDRAAPGYDEVFRVAGELVPFDARDTFLVADLGAGTGLFSDQLAQRFPKARFELIDGSEEMLAKARARFGASDPRFRFERIDFQDWTESARFDVAVSSLAIHHLEHDEKQAFFRRIYAALKPGGVFGGERAGGG